MARWLGGQIVEYFPARKRERREDKVNNMGYYDGQPVLMVVITSPANHAKLEHLRQ